MKFYSYLVVVAISLFVILPGQALAGVPMNIGDYVWFDENGNGLQDEGPDAGINDVRVIFYRDYECNGVFDNYDEIYDYDYTMDGPDGLAGWYMIPSISSFCFVAYLDETTIPVDMIVTTQYPLPIDPPADADYLDADFGLGYEIVPPVPAYACPKTIGFWKQQFRFGSAMKYDIFELIAIVEGAIDQTPLFKNFGIFQYLFNLQGNVGSFYKALRQFAALTLNLAVYDLIDYVDFPAGLDESTPLDLPELTDATTVGQAYEEVEYYLLTKTNLELANTIADSINNGLGIDVNCDL